VGIQSNANPGIGSGQICSSGFDAGEF